MRKRLKQILKDRGITQSALADAVGVNKSFMSDLIAGKKNPSMDTQQAIAEFLDVQIGAIFGHKRPVAVAGRVGAGASVELVDSYAKGAGLYHIAAPDDLPASGIVAVEVIGESMLPLIEEGDIILFSRTFMGIDQNAVGHVGICETEDGRALIKLIQPGREAGTFDLFSLNPNIPPEYAVRLTWAAPYRRHLRRMDVEFMETTE